MDPYPRGPDWMPITPKTGSLFHAESHPVGRNPPARRLAEPPVDEPGLAVLLVSPRPAPERPLAHPEQLGRLRLVELRRFPAVKKLKNLAMRTASWASLRPIQTLPKGPDLPDRSCAT